MKRLLSLKKLVVMLTFLLCGFCQAENAQAKHGPVRVSDLGVERFVDMCNHYLSSSGRSERISLYGISKSDNLYDYWEGFIKRRNINMVFFVNKEGYVSELGIISAKDYESFDSAGIVLHACLDTIGLTDNERAKISNQHLQTGATVWGSNINRYVGVKMGYENDNMMIYIGGYKY